MILHPVLNSSSWKGMQREHHNEKYISSIFYTHENLSLGWMGIVVSKPPKRSNRSSVISSICKPYKLHILQLKRRCWFNEPHLKTCGIFLCTLLPLNPFSLLSEIVHHLILWMLYFFILVRKGLRHIILCSIIMYNILFI